MNQDIFSIGQLAKRSSCSVGTIRFYEQKGLIFPVLRSQSNYRKYDEESLRRLVFISRSKDLGFTLTEIGELLELHEDNDSQCDSVRDRCENKLAAIRVKIESLKAIENALVQLNQRCTSREDEVCPILSFLEGDFIAPHLSNILPKKG